jgi:hypothetical protein
LRSVKVARIQKTAPQIGNAALDLALRAGPIRLATFCLEAVAAGAVEELGVDAFEADENLTHVIVVYPPPGGDAHDQIRVRRYAYYVALGFARNVRRVGPAYRG